MGVASAGRGDGGSTSGAAAEWYSCVVVRRKSKPWPVVAQGLPVGGSSGAAAKPAVDLLERLDLLGHTVDLLDD